jgi:putative MATE family efflux protein
MRGDRPRTFEREPLDLREKTLSRTLFRLAGPAILENLMFSIVFFADSLIVGWLHSEASLAAAALAGVSMYLVNSPFYALSIATSSLVARSWGERAFDTARHYTGLSLSIAAGLALLIFCVAWPASRGILSLLGAAADVRQLGAPYLRIILLSGIAGLPMIVMNGAIRASGNTRTPMVITILMNVINVVVSLALAFGLGPFEPLGLYGVAWGTVVARTTGGLLSLAVLLSPRVGLGMRARDFALRRSEQLGAIWRLAMPAMVDRVLHTGAHVAFMRIVALLGTTALAGHNIALHVESLAFMPVVGVSMAVVALVGQAIGAGLPDIAEKAVKRGILWSFLLMLAIGAVFVAFAPVGVRVFGATPGVIRLAGTALQIAALELPFLSFAIVFSSALRAAGDTRSPLWVNLFCLVTFRLAGVYLLGVYVGWGLPGVWLATAIDWAARGAGLWFFFRRGAWKYIHQREKGPIA